MIRKRKIVTVLMGVLMSLGLIVVTMGTASATQTGLQQIVNPSNSQSGYTVNFPNSCGSFGVNPGTVWGEGVNGPGCGGVTGNSEPGSVYLGPGWCATRSIWDDYDYPSQTLGYQNLAAGGSGHWFKLWQSSSSKSSVLDFTNRDYHNLVKAWHGAGCPTTGGAWVDDNPPGVEGVDKNYFTNPPSDGYEW